MLKEQLLQLAMKTMARVNEAKEELEKQWRSKEVQDYLHNLKRTARSLIDNQIKETSKNTKKERPTTAKKANEPRKAKAKPKTANKKSEVKDKPKTDTKRTQAKTQVKVKNAKKKTQIKTPATTKTPPKKTQAKPQVTAKVTEKKAIAAKRKPSVRSARQIDSDLANTILSTLKKENRLRLKKTDNIDGKKSLAGVIWALGHAEEAKLNKGISVHDVSALLYKARGINLYPINISRVVHASPNLIRLVSEKEKPKRYLLSPEGKKVFTNKYL